MTTWEKLASASMDGARLTAAQRKLIWTSREVARLRPELIVFSQPSRGCPPLRVLPFEYQPPRWVVINRRGVPVPPLKKYLQKNLAR